MASIAGPSPAVGIEMLPPASASDSNLVGQITDLVNRVYDTAENGLWVEGAARTTTTQMAELIAADQIAVAQTGGQV
jgi:hypothetical protein